MKKKPEYDKDYILDTVFAFQRSKIIMAANKHDIFTHLDKNPMTREEIARETNAKTEQIGILLDALVSMHILEKTNEDKKYRNTEAAEACLVKDKPGYYGDMIKHINDTYQG